MMRRPAFGLGPLIGVRRRGLPGQLWSRSQSSVTVHACASAAARRTAAGLVIGNEILTGKTLDTNTQTLATFLFQRGVQLRKCEIVLDDVPTISKAVARLAATHDYVFTSGGIGPTLDDMTYESVADAFGLELKEHPETIKRMHAISPNMDLNEARLRMATLPTGDGVSVFWTDKLWVPTVCVGDGKVFVLPGVPRLYRAMLEALPEAAVSAGDGFVRRASSRIDTMLPEGDIAALLNDIATRFPSVALGSYPNDRVQNPDQKYNTKLTLEADTEGDVRAASAALTELVRAAEVDRSNMRQA